MGAATIKLSEILRYGNVIRTRLVKLAQRSSRVGSKCAPIELSEEAESARANFFLFMYRNPSYRPIFEHPHLSNSPFAKFLDVGNGFRERGISFRARYVWASSGIPLY